MLTCLLALLAACDAHRGEPPTRPAPKLVDLDTRAFERPAPFGTNGADGEGSDPNAAAQGAFPGRSALGHAVLHELSGEERRDEPLRFGIPFGRGVLDEVAPLRVWSVPDGAPLPSQSRALSHWDDGSVRWALVDVRAELDRRQARTVAVGPAQDILAGADPWTVVQREDGGIVIGDGQREWLVLDPTNGDAVLGLRAHLTDRFGYVYRAAVTRTDDVQVLERGPLRMTVRLTGEHRSVDAAALPIPFHTFTAWIHLHAGTPVAEVEWSLENGPLHEPPGPLAFRSYTLATDVPRDIVSAELPGRTFAVPSQVTVTAAAGGTRAAVDDEAPFAIPGDLWMGLRGPEHDVFVHRFESAGNHPNAVRWRARDALSIALLAPGEGREFFLDDATRKTFRFTLARDAGDEGVSRMRAAAEPSHVSLPPLEVAISGAWGDAGFIHVPGAGDDLSAPMPPQKMPRGWTDWGEASARNTHTSGSPRNRLSVFLEAVQTQRADLFRWARTRAYHAMDLRPFHIQGFDADLYPWANLYEGVPHPNNKPEQSLGRKGMATRHTRYKQGLPPEGNGYNGFDPEHMTLDDVYECYLLTGSWPALGALRSAGEAMLTWQELRPDGWIHSSRTFGWTLRALVQVHRATGEERYLDAARRYVARADAERGKGEVKYLRRMRADPRHLDEPHDTVFMVAVALHGLAAYWDETGDPLVPAMCADLTEYCMSGFRGASGFLADLPTDRPEPAGQAFPRGVSVWVPGAIAAAAFVTGDHAPVDRLRPYAEAMAAPPENMLSIGHRDWHWWQPYLASVRMRAQARGNVLREPNLEVAPDTQWHSVPEWTEGLVEEPTDLDWMPPQDDGQ